MADYVHQPLKDVPTAGIGRFLTPRTAPSVKVRFKKRGVQRVSGQAIEQAGLIRCAVIDSAESALLQVSYVLCNDFLVFA
jgi:hypothetical protein